MSEKNNIKTICVRFNLSKPLHRKAYNFLKEQSESKSAVVIKSVADYFDNHERDERLAQKIISALSGAVNIPAVSEKQAEESISSEIDFDFLGG